MPLARKEYQVITNARQQSLNPSSSKVWFSPLRSIKSSSVRWSPFPFSLFCYAIISFYNVFGFGQVHSTRQAMSSAGRRGASHTVWFGIGPADWRSQRANRTYSSDYLRRHPWAVSWSYATISGWWWASVLQLCLFGRLCWSWTSQSGNAHSIVALQGALSRQGDLVEGESRMSPNHSSVRILWRVCCEIWKRQCVEVVLSCIWSFEHCCGMFSFSEFLIPSIASRWQNILRSWRLVPWSIHHWSSGDDFASAGNSASGIALRLGLVWSWRYRVWTMGDQSTWRRIFIRTSCCCRGMYFLRWFYADGLVQSCE